MIRPILERSGLKAGEDFFLVYSPERVLPGQILRELIENARVIGGIDPASASAGRDLYTTFVRGEIFTTDATTAEMVKLMENTYRDVNIAIANEFARLADRFGVDVWEAITIANRHPRVRVLNPGPGVGGHCISVDPWFLVEAAPDLTPLIRTARQVNDAQPAFVVDIVQRFAGGSLKDQKVAVLGLSYKPDVDDLRESPAIEVALLLQQAGALVQAYEPVKPEAQVPGLILCPNLASALEGADVLLLLVGHTVLRQLDPVEVAQLTPARVVVDAVNGWSCEAWAASGFHVYQLGNGKLKVTSSLRVLSIFGTRPEAVKMAPVVQRLALTPGIEPQVCVTAQHRQMLDQVLDLFQIQPDIDLDLMRPNQGLPDLTAAILTRLDPVLERLHPDWILIQGDTTTVMTAALLAFYRGIHVGHVEAGLRTGDKRQPFPEEINRRMTSVIADLHFAPTEHNRQNLLVEGVPAEQIVVTGNTVIDALQAIAARPVPAEAGDLLAKLGIVPGGKRLVYVTAHRRENFGRPLEQICEALRCLAEAYRGRVEFVYPVHLNPNVQGPVYRLLGKLENITLLPPMDYLPHVHLLKQASLVLTDSGGIQEEAPGLGVPTLVLREVTERPEGVEAGTLALVGTDPQRIISAATHLLDDPAAHAAMAQAVNPFGDGQAAGRIVQFLLAQSLPR